MNSKPSIRALALSLVLMPGSASGAPVAISPPVTSLEMGGLTDAEPLEMTVESIAISPQIRDTAIAVINLSLTGLKPGRSVRLEKLLYRDEEGREVRDALLTHLTDKEEGGKHALNLILSYLSRTSSIKTLDITFFLGESKSQTEQIPVSDLLRPYVLDAGCLALQIQSMRWENNRPPMFGHRPAAPCDGNWPVIQTLAVGVKGAGVAPRAANSAGKIWRSLSRRSDPRRYQSYGLEFAPDHGPTWTYAVAEVDPCGPAVGTGIHPGDVVREQNGQRLDAGHHLQPADICARGELMEQEFLIRSASGDKSVRINPVPYAAWVGDAAQEERILSDLTRAAASEEPVRKWYHSAFSDQPFTQRELPDKLQVTWHSPGKPFAHPRFILHDIKIPEQAWK